MRRWISALSLTLAALVAGCDTSSGSIPKWTPMPPWVANPVAVVQQATQRSLSSTLTISGTVMIGDLAGNLRADADPKAHAIHFLGDVPAAMEAWLIGDTAYLKMETLESERPWVKIDMARLKPTSSLRLSFDLHTRTGIVAGIVSAEKVGEGFYRGIADLEKAAAAPDANGSMRWSIESAKSPKAVPFEATVDTDGRLTALSYTIATKDMDDAVSDVRMSGFGEPVTVTTPPSGEVEEASEEMYAIL
jgi:hypothetical protein